MSSLHTLFAQATRASNCVRTLAPFHPSDKVAQRLVSFNVVPKFFTVWVRLLCTNFTLFMRLFRCYSQKWILSFPNDLVGMGNQVQGEILKHHKGMSGCRLLVKWAEAETRHGPPVFVCKVNVTRLLNDYEVLGFPFLSDELKSNGAAGEGSYECASARSASCRSLSPSLGRARPHLPLPSVKKGRMASFLLLLGRLQESTEYDGGSLEDYI